MSINHEGHLFEQYLLKNEMVPVSGTSIAMLDCGAYYEDPGGHIWHESNIVDDIETMNEQELAELSHFGTEPDEAQQWYNEVILGDDI